MRPHHGKACPAVEDSLGKGDEMGGRGKLHDGLQDLRHIFQGFAALPRYMEIIITFCRGDGVAEERGEEE